MKNVLVVAGVFLVVLIVFGCLYDTGHEGDGGIVPGVVPPDIEFEVTFIGEPENYCYGDNLVAADGALHYAGYRKIEVDEYDTDYMLTYGSWTSEGWKREDVIEHEWDIRRMAIRLDSAGRPMIVYQLAERYYGDPIQLHLAVKEGDEWTDELILSFDYLGDFDFELDAQGQVHIAVIYYTQEESRLKYVTGQPGAWNIEDVYGIDDSNNGVDLALDGDTTHILFLYTNWIGHDDDSTDENKVVYAVRSGGTAWSTNVIREADETGLFPFLAIGGDGKAVTIFSEEDDVEYPGWKLIYATGGITGWTGQVYDSGVVYSGVTAFQAQDMIHVVYGKREYGAGVDNIYYGNDSGGSMAVTQVGDLETGGIVAAGTDSQNRVVVYHYLDDYRFEQPGVYRMVITLH